MPDKTVQSTQDTKVANAPRMQPADKPTITRLNHHGGASFGFVTKPDLAKQLKVSVRSVDNLVRRRAIPVIRLSPRCVRFDPQAVRRALSKFEVLEVGHRA